MKILITAILLLLSISFSFSQNKYSKKLTNKASKISENEKISIIVYFSDKGNDIDKKLEKAEKLLPEKSKLRRIKTFKRKNNLATFYDIPVEDDYCKQIISKNIKLRRKLKWLNAITIEADKKDISKISKLNFVEKIDLVRTLKTNRETETFIPFAGNEISNSLYNLDYGTSLTQLEQINVPAFHDLDASYTGAGVNICVLDAGFNNLEHEVFSNMNIVYSYDYVNNDENVDDEGDMGVGNHGTMTLSNIGGFKEGELIGAAYGANFYLAKTENTDSETTVEEDNWAFAIDYMETNFGIDVSSTSLGYVDFDDGEFYDASELDGNTAIITKAADIAASLGILVINSAGNSGDGVTTIGAPADADSVLAVGAVDASGLKAGFSSVGPTGDGRIKPELMALGVDAYVADVLNNDYRFANGTSFSCPILAGGAALLVQTTDATNMEIIEALKNTASQHENPDNSMGWGIADVLEAYRYLVPSSVNEKDENKLTIYPNPVKDYIFINNFNSEEILEIKIYSITGKLVLQKNSNFMQIDISNFKEGIYFLNILSTNNLVIKKFIKQ